MQREKLQIRQADFGGCHVQARREADVPHLNPITNNCKFASCQLAFQFQLEGIDHYRGFSLKRDHANRFQWQRERCVQRFQGRCRGDIEVGARRGEITDQAIHGELRSAAFQAGVQYLELIPFQSNLGIHVKGERRPQLR